MRAVCVTARCFHLLDVEKDWLLGAYGLFYKKEDSAVWDSYSNGERKKYQAGFLIKMVSGKQGNENALIKTCMIWMERINQL